MRRRVLSQVQKLHRRPSGGSSVLSSERQHSRPSSAELTEKGFRGVRFKGTLGLVGVNAVVHTMWLNAKDFNPCFSPSGASKGITKAFMYRHFSTNWNSLRRGRWHTAITSCFSQCEVAHFLLNGIGLCVFGPLLEKSIGGVRMVAGFCLTGAAGCVAQAFVTHKRHSGDVVLGASGGVYGLFAMMCCRNPGLPMYVFGVWKVSLSRLLAISLLIEGIDLCLGRRRSGAVGHLTGLFCGGLLHGQGILLRRIGPTLRFWKK
uniref:Peptidase S54 rhomboid domain-containing protein n=1 Tax=Chromera velia CCMP2878 TaxID=1169474 RepID=A0A0G4HBW6_9ALVE|eukprot:Cvel_26085.t1-p1 / transcript=Cvel_26085.t1 / gene=Cvel_26085 / organism=Chromera_velia_CCMP2878 / gene_product=hypothetical protein / transcript_product=hypothetical protein / location=Cvel_scaffold3047:4455-6191(+) / protein_length=260 / sequence_SO=supercontig / SO=protein_coding / is_pseudo=false